jgi:hypothetical protein
VPVLFYIVFEPPIRFMPHKIFPLHCGGATDMPRGEKPKIIERNRGFSGKRKNIAA